MSHILLGIFAILHGMVHMWYVTLAQRWVPFEADMGWTGESWLLTGAISDSATRTIATLIYAISTVAFVIGGVGIIARVSWWQPVIIAAAIISTLAIIVFWDGSANLLVQKGLIGLLINAGLLALLLLVDWPLN